MSKSSKTARAVRRKAEKRARKEAQKARYRSFADSGKNHKSKRASRASQRSGKVRDQRHINGNCQNIGCVRCSATALGVKLREEERRRLSKAVHPKKMIDG